MSGDSRRNSVVSEPPSRVANERAAAHVFAFSNDLMGSADRDGYFTALNPAWERALGFSYENLMQQPFIHFVHPGDREATNAEMARLADEGVGPVHFENRYAVRGGGWLWLSWQIQVCDEGYYFIARDVTPQLVANQRHDLSTSIIEGVDDAIMTTTTDGVVTWWNRASEELYGFPADEAIGRSATDLLVAPDLSDEPERIVARLLAGEGVRQYTTQRCHKDGAILTVSLTASLLRDAEQNISGVAVVSRDVSEMDIDEDSQFRGELDTLAWVGRIRDAIDEDRIVFYAQPIIRLDGTSRSYELLCRIEDRDGGIVPPRFFLPAAEGYGLVAELDLLAVAEGARQIAGGNKVNINLSTASIGRRHIVDIIADRLRDANADPSMLTVEITETSLIRDIVAAERFAAEISKLGCKIALDDFGTGFGGFTYLKKMHVDQLKIDVEFVRDLPSSDASQHVVQAVVALARGLGLETVAEGVEDEQTCSLLRDYGVTYVQGYLYGEPGPLAEVVASGEAAERNER